MKRGVLQLIFDLLIIAAATWAALLLRDNLEFSWDRARAIVPYLGFTLVLAVPVLVGARINQSIWRLSGFSDLIKIVVAVVGIVVGAVALGFIVQRLEGVPRALPLIQCLLAACAMVGVRVVMRVRHSRRQHRQPSPVTHFASRSEPSERETILIAGMNPITELYLQSLAEFTPERVMVAGILGRSERHTGRLVRQYKVLGTPEHVADVLRDLEIHGVVVDRIVITSAFNRLSEEARSALLHVERNSTIRLDFFAERFQLDAGAGEVGGRSGSASTTGHGVGEAGALTASLSAPLVGPADVRPQGVYWQVKRALDVALAAILLAVLAPVIVAVALIVAVDVGLPVTFWQQRPGRFGQPFRLWKFRSMKAAHDHMGHRISDEQRQSRFGKFMRRTRLDELPQLYNILIGEMSFVGPRPLLQRDQHSDAFARLLVRPGLTGWAQINGGTTVTVEDKMALDLWYMRHANFWLDLRIMSETARIVLLGERANPIAVRMAWTEIAAADNRTVGVDASTDLIGLQSRRVA